ncbi:MAG: VCBS repeat-containing protein [Bryobacterales bacterium]|nr:VCBS repeat-containing protein [Bryobacterales bacterium]
MSTVWQALACGGLQPAKTPTLTRREFFTATAFALAAPPESSGAPLQVTYRRAPAYLAYRDKLRDPADGPMSPPAAAPLPSSTSPMFADVTGTVLDSEQLSRGIPYWMARLEAGTGIDIYGNNGLAVGDIDGDGVDEIYVCQPAGLPNRLFRWREGKLEDISAAAGVDLLDDSASALFLDLRNLGRQDLVVLRGSSPVLFLNDGQGRFTLAPDAFRFATPPQGAFTGMAAADYDRDGKLDIYCCAYSFFRSEAQFLYPTPYFDAQNGPPNFLFHNRLNADGTGYFEDVTAAVGLNENNNRYSFAPAWCDYDGSGWPSLYVANDFGRNNLYRNDKGKFRDVAVQAGVEDIGPGMSAAWFDLSGDGHPDLYVANMWTAPGQRVTKTDEFRQRYPGLDETWRRHTKGNSLYRNRGDGRFEDVGARMGVEMGRWAWSADAADLDFDGRPEILVTCGMLTGPRADPDLMSFFWREVVAKTPADAERSAAYEEGWNAINQFIREGYSWNGGERNVFYLWPAHSAQYEDFSRVSGLDFAGDSRAFAFTDIDGDGALDIVVKNRLAPQLRVFQNRFATSRPMVAIRLRGTVSNRDGIGARVMVGGGGPVQWLAAGSGYLSQHSKTMHFRAGEYAEVVWPSGQKQRVDGLTAYALHEITEGEGMKVVRRFPREQTKIAAREAAADNTPRLQDTWVQDPLPLPDRHRGPGLPVLTNAELHKSPDLAAAYALFRRYLFEYRAELELPLALLLNDAGEAVKIYASVPTPATVTADLKQVAQRRALPYPGRALSQPRRDYFKLGAALLWSGYGDYALPYLERVLADDPANTRTMVLAAQVHREAGRADQAARLLDEALRLQPALAEAWNERGGLALASKKPEDALEHFEQALASQPDLLYALLNAAQTAAQLNRLDQAAAYYRRARAAHPRSADAANGLGLTRAKQGVMREAEALLREAVTLDPGLASAWNNLAVLLMRDGRKDEALDALERGIAQSPGDEALYLNLGRLYVQGGDRAKAAETMRRLLKENPASAVARKALADLEGK